MNEREFLQRLRTAFRTEAEERLNTFASTLLELENASDRDGQQVLIETLFREAHSLKGAAGAVNLANIQTVCQSVESIFSAMKRGETEPSPRICDEFHRGLSIIEEILSSPEHEQDSACQDACAEYCHTLAALTTGEAEVGHDVDAVDQLPASAPAAIALESDKGGHEGKPALARSVPNTAPTVRVPTSKLDSVLLKAEEMISLKLSWNQQLSRLKRAESDCELWKKRWARYAPEARSAGKKLKKVSSGSSGNLDTALYTELLGFLEWNHQFVEAVGRQIKTLSSSAVQDQRALNSMVDDLLTDMKQVTMLPLSTLLDLFPRMVRDISRGQGKEVDLQIEGENIEVDRRILEEMKDPVIHLLRNCIDHGLETPDERELAGKRRRGTISVRISQTEGDKMEIRVADDGRGLDLARVREGAVRAGLLSSQEAGQLDDEEALSLIFRSGVSTSPLITNLSGRGLGMSIVQERVDGLGGWLFPKSTPGDGFSVSIHLPVTLATFRGLLVRASEALFVLPSSNVELVLRVERGSVKTVEGRATIALNGKAVSMADLGEVLGLPHREAEKGRANLTMVVLRAAAQRIAFNVDEVLGEQEVLVKSLGRQLRRVRNISGATILGSGEVVPILNPVDLMISASGSSTLTIDRIDAEKSVGRQVKSILVVEDSITSRMLIKNILESSGYSVHTAVDGLEAFTSMKTERFDLVVSDVEMPRVNGFELTKRIRGDDQLADIPVILITSLESREDRERGIDAGANAYLAKSNFDQNNLLEVVRRFL